MRSLKLTLLLFVLAFAPWVAIAANNPLGQNVQGCQERGSIAANQRGVLLAGEGPGGLQTLVQTDANGNLTVSGGGGGGGAVTVADGADVTQGTIADAATTGAGTVNAHLRSIALALVSPLTVAVNNFPATQPVSGTVAVSNFPATQPVSGTVTANQGTTPWTNQGAQAAAAAITTNPFLMAGQNGGNVKLFGLDASGFPTANQGTPNGAGANSWPIQGAVGVGGAVVGNPNVIGGRDASGNAQFIGGNNSGVFAQGPAAAGAALAGGPVRIGISDGTNINDVTCPVSAGGSFTNPARLGLLSAQGYFYDRNVNVWRVIEGATADALTIGTIPYYGGSDFNGATTDRHRNNLDAILLASASRTTTQTSADITTYNLGAIAVYLNVTVNTIGSVTLSINEKDPASGVYNPLLTGVAIVATGFSVYRVDPRTPAVANSIAQIALPRIIQIVVTANNANAVTYSVGYTLKVVLGDTKLWHSHFRLLAMLVDRELRLWRRSTPLYNRRSLLC